LHKVLFVCTANIYRSRFSEEVYNFFARKLELSSRAFSAGLMVGHYKTRTIYAPAMEYLNRLNIIPRRKDELSIHINDLDLDEYDKIICMDKNEHESMVNANKRLDGLNIEYWDIIDEPLVSRQISLPKCYKRVENLVNHQIKEPKH
tara:strand:- start:63 stop:503 length:441 start_codon:yes stop_codon:yes gene_type:complete